MTAQVSEATRHVMQANKSKNTKPELLVRQALRAAGLPGYRLHW
jgi:DNA mismatch endonuclease (patch repair protein)